MYKTPGYKNDIFEFAADPVQLAKDLKDINSFPYAIGSGKWMEFMENLWDEGNLTAEAIEKISKFFNIKNWSDLIYYFSLPEDFLRRNMSRLNFHTVCRFQAASLSEKFILDYKNRFAFKDWFFISSRAQISEEFIENHLIDCSWDWSGLSSRIPPLSERFLDRHANLVDWGALSDCFSPTFSWRFIKKHEDEWDWETIVRNRWSSLTPDTVMTFEYKINNFTLLARKEQLIKYCGFDEEFFKDWEP